MKFAVEVFGCKVNQYESARWQLGLKEHLAESVDDAQVVIIFSCVVTHKAEAEVRRTLNKWLKQGKKVIITGCGTRQTLTDIVSPNVTLVPIEDMNTYMEKHWNVRAPNIVPYIPNHSRAFVKVQDGCSWRCSYCLSSIERGSTVSRPSDDVLQEINLMVQKGVKEIVLTGTNLLLWHQNELNIFDLFEKVGDLAYHKSIRVRISSVYPQMVTDRFINLFKRYPFARHLHISLQSGSDSVLRHMNRTPLQNLPQMLEGLLRLDENFAFTADVIVGYPTETEQDFVKTMVFTELFGFSKLHLFPFSPRSGTKANELKPLNGDIISRRMEVLSLENVRLKKRFISRQENTFRDAVFLQDDRVALTDNFIYVPSQPFNGIKPVKIVPESYII